MEFFCPKRLVIGGSILMFFFRSVRIDIKVICKTYFLKQKKLTTYTYNIYSIFSNVQKKLTQNLIKACHH